MKRKSVAIVLSGLLFFTLFATIVFAQEQDKPITPDQQVIQPQPVVQEQPRVIEEALVLSDPTVAQSKKWLIGLSGEYWYVSQKNDRYVCTNSDCSITDLYAAGTMKGKLPGGTVTFGYDKLTVSYSYRKGSFDSESTLQPNYTSNHSYQPTTGTEDQTEHELTLRVLLGPGSPHFNPYFMIGYNQIDRTITETLVNPGWTWNVNGSPTLRENITMKAPFIGLGAIIPFNKYIGMRLDGRFLYVRGDYAMEGVDSSGLPRKETETLYGCAAVGTFYWAIWKGLNAQVGGKWQYTSQGDGKHYIDSANKWGAFGMIGYTLKF